MFLLWLQHSRTGSSATVKKNCFASLTQPHQLVGNCHSCIHASSGHQGKVVQPEAPGMLPQMATKVGVCIREGSEILLLVASTTAIFMPTPGSAVLWPKEGIL